MIESVVATDNVEPVRTETAESPSMGSPKTGGAVGGTRLDMLLADFERQVILSTLQSTDGTRSLAARKLGISRSRLYRRLEALGIEQDIAKA